MRQFEPLAARMRPSSLADIVGQSHLLAPGKPLNMAITSGKMHSMIFWGPPGTGKTTLARLFAQQTKAEFIALSAVMAGVKDIRAAVASAKQAKDAQGVHTLLFIDEVHRFNKAQQDAFLPFVEEGTFIFIGATTENPSFEVNSALLSRARVYVLKRLSDEALLTVLDNALTSPHGLDALQLKFPNDLRQQLVASSDGDARRLLNLLEIIAELVSAENTDRVVTAEIITEVLTDTTRQFDKYGEAFYDQISALHKSVRGSSPDAALYWLTRMLDGGCDPIYIARRIVRMASEDIGNADPRALTLALNAWDVQVRLGSPEGELSLAQAIIYMAVAPKSNATYTAFQSAKRDIEKYGSLPIPLHLRNAPTKLMKQLDYGKDYRYAHDEPNAYAAGERYFPEGMPEKSYYKPVDRGLEKQISEKLNWLKKLDKEKT